MELLESGLERADMLRMKLCCAGFYEGLWFKHCSVITRFSVFIVLSLVGNITTNNDRR